MSNAAHQRSRWLSRASAAAALLALFVALTGAASAGAATPHTIVSLGFDDGLASQYTARAILAAHGMHGTFFIISGSVGSSGYMTWSQIGGLASDGNEIAGHTLNHPDLTAIDPTEARRQICDDRSQLLANGFQVTDMAYPYGTFNPQVEQIAQACGYNSARSTLWYGANCANPCTESIPPRDPFATTVVGFSDETLSVLESQVMAAEATGGWAQIVFHEVCNGCATGAISPATLSAFLDWLQPRAATGTVVQTIQDVIGGPVQPAVAGPPPPPAPDGTNGMPNPGLELDSNGDGMPDCFAAGAFGSLTATWTRTTSAHTGTYAEKVDVSGYVSGDAKLVEVGDAGGCTPSVTAGHQYKLWVWYRSTVPAYFTAFTRNTSFAFSYWMNSPTFPASSTWALASWTTPAIPAGITGLQSGLTISSNGSLTVDDMGIDEDGAPPVISAPPPLTNSKSASIAFSGETGATFTCSVDGGAFAACSSPKSLSGLADGPHSLAVKQTDGGGNVSAASSVSWIVDTVAAPPVLSGAPPALTNIAPASIGFTGEPGATFTCSVDGGAFAVCSSPRVLSGLADGSHGFAVRQTDLAGNTSAASSVSWVLDTVAAAPLLSGAPAALTNATSASIGFTGESAATFTCSLDGGAFAACTPPTVLSALVDGPHSLAVRQTDLAGNTSVAATASWTVDTIAAAPALSGVPAAQTNTRSASIGFAGEAGATFKCSLDGGAFAACSSPKILSSLPDGLHSLAVEQTDLAGNVSAASSVSWSVDTVAAPPVLSGAPPALTNIAPASIGFTGEPGATFTCSVDGGAFAVCSSPRVLSGLADGSHGFAVRQTDLAGNTSAASSVSWVLDTVAAAPLLSGAPAALTNATSASIGFTGESAATFTCSLDGGAFAACTPPTVLSALVDGPHSLAVRQTDLAGNTSVAATASWTVDTIAAAPALSGVPAAQTNARSASIGFAGEAGATFKCSLDGGAFAACSSPKILSSLPDGLHSLAVEQTDLAGNVSAASSVSWSVDTTVAAPVLSGAPPALTSATSTSIAFTGEAGATYLCALDGGPFSACSSPELLSGLAEGAHSLAVVQVDAAGNVSLSAAASWTIQTPPPGGASASPTPPAARTEASAGRVRARTGALLITIVCPASASGSCVGSLVLRAASGSAARSRIATVMLLGRATYTVKAGGARTVTLHLSKAAQRLLKQRRTLRVTLVLRDGGGHVIRRLPLVLHAPKAP